MSSGEYKAFRRSVFKAADLVFMVGTVLYTPREVCVLIIFSEYVAVSWCWVGRFCLVFSCTV